MPNDLQNPKSDRAAKLLIGGRRAVHAYGIEIIYRPQDKLTRISKRQINIAIMSGRVDQMRSWIEPVLVRAIESMPGLTHNDLWRDPEVAMNIYRGISEN